MASTNPVEEEIESAIEREIERDIMEKCVLSGELRQPIRDEDILLLKSFIKKISIVQLSSAPVV